MLLEILKLRKNGYVFSVSERHMKDNLLDVRAVDVKISGYGFSNRNTTYHHLSLDTTENWIDNAFDALAEWKEDKALAPVVDYFENELRNIVEHN